MVDKYPLLCPTESCLDWYKSFSGSFGANINEYKRSQTIRYMKYVIETPKSYTIVKYLVTLLHILYGFIQRNL